jgi:ketosteroid isomerase-like protein
MKTKSIIFLFLTMLVIVSCAPKSIVSKEQALADSLLTVNVTAWNSGDAQIIADMYTDDCLYFDNGKGIWGKDSTLAIIKTVATVIKNFKATLGPTTVSTDLVFMQKYWTLDYMAGENALKTKGLSIIVWIKQADNSWKISREKSDYSIKTY